MAAVSINGLNKKNTRSSIILYYRSYITGENCNYSIRKITQAVSLCIILAIKVSVRHLDTQTLTSHSSRHPDYFNDNFF